MSEYQASAEQLLASANDSTKHVRTVYLTFLLLLTYTGVIIGSTTDEQLLLVDQVTLPLLNVGLPILQFYILAPWLVILFHFNLLLQFSLTARCLHELNSAIERIDNLEGSDIFRARLFPFHFSHLLAGHHPSVSIRLLLMVIVWTTVILLPLALLLWAQIRFLPYHDTSITWAHRLTLLTDLVLLWVLWPMIVMPESNVSAWWRGLITGGMRRARLLFNYLVMFIRAPR